MQIQKGGYRAPFSCGHTKSWVCWPAFCSLLAFLGDPDEQGWTLLGWFWGDTALGAAAATGMVLGGEL